MRSKNLNKDLVLDEDMAYLIGVIIGDGHISNNTKSKTDLSKDYQINIELTNYDYLKEVELLFKKFVKTKSATHPLKKREGKKQSWVFRVRNKELYLYLTKIIGIPCGSKSGRLFIPENIMKGNDAIKKNFISGFFDTDGGKRGNALGFSMKSEQLQKDISSLLKELKIRHYNERWFNKKYQLYYYGIKLSKKFTKMFLYEVPLRNKSKFNEILNLFNADVPERSNGIEDHS